MKNQATELRPDIIEQFCGGAWYTAHEPLTLRRSAMLWTMPICAAFSFAVILVSLVGFLGGG